MAEPKVSIDEAIQHISSTLTHHADSIHRFDTQLTSLRNDTQQEIRSLETRLTSLIESKNTLWTTVSEDMQTLNAGLLELKNIILTHNMPPTRSNDQLSPSHSPPPPDTPARPILLSHTNFPTTNATTTERSIVQLPPTIVLPPTSSIPTFSGKPTERPRQFLLRLEEYTRTVNRWSRETLLRGISQFLKDDALEWYCQLRHSNNTATNWDDFVTRFLAQFHSPIRIAQQEQAWTHCKQQTNETINQFVVRLRSLWLEQKPDEDESGFTKHLFCKMRPDMLNLMNFSQSSSLEDILREAQKVEEILFLRNKEQRQRDLQSQKLTSTTNFFSLTPPPSTSSTAPNKVNHESWINSPRNSRSSTQAQQRSQPNQSQSSRSNVTCWRCYEVGHYSTECPLNNDQSPSVNYDNSSSQNPHYLYQPLLPRQKKNE
jgi:hypothetical protein